VFEFCVKLNQGCGYFKWDEEEVISISEMNMLEERVEDLPAKVEKWQVSVNNLKGLKARSSTGGNVKFLLSEVKMLKEENMSLRSKITKEKMKKVKVVEELKHMKEEMIAMKMKDSGNNRVDRIYMCLAFVIVVVLLVRLV